ncbi:MULTISPECIES: hypothetical protein [Citrobacter freundii complex]|uniref:hypothetical protein n=1 Tax=Citrobacter freundii complex TaxID=1344959 RepID=UPI0006505AF3|nr:MULTISPECIES: hypothetical protein [Citrobacter freundii complex]EKV4359853.1 hypothetical protein [Citrobacter freundii]ELE2062793.1 hypothetical protein [Citrobacter freundii]ELK6675835.1 hypothetical protein [Citrobacter freundii]KLV84179.1 hypothetical protein SK37_01933 [Citrobacter sp. MGH109]MBN4827957.1 hypothetical protein [Citrobacter freundii]
MNEINTILNEIPEWFSSFITALIGAVVGGFFTLRGVDREARITRAEAERESIELQLSVLKGIKGEVSTLIDLYNKRMRESIDGISPGKMLLINFPVGDDNFTFYEQNAKVIARLNDTARDSIINIYTYARSLIQSFKGNNQLVMEYEKILFDMADNNKNKDMYERLHEAKIEVMVDYAQGIKMIDSELMDVIDRGFNAIDKEISELQVNLTSLDVR